MPDDTPTNSDSSPLHPRPVYTRFDPQRTPPPPRPRCIPDVVMKEIRARYRKEVLCLPNEVDRWVAISLLKKDPRPPPDPDHPPRRVLPRYWADEAKGKLWVERTEGELYPDSDDDCFFGPVFDPPVYRLYLSIHILPASGGWIYNRDSPAIKLADFTGEEKDLEAPDWVRAVPRDRAHAAIFYRSREHLLGIAEMAVKDMRAEQRLDFMGDARNTEDIDSWCKVFSTETLEDQTGATSTPKTRSATRALLNKRSHKPRASDYTDQRSKYERARIMGVSPTPTYYYPPRTSLSDMVNDYRRAHPTIPYHSLYRHGPPYR